MQARIHMDASFEIHCALVSVAADMLHAVPSLWRRTHSTSFLMHGLQHVAASTQPCSVSAWLSQEALVGPVTPAHWFCSPVLAIIYPPFAGSETPSRTSWGHFFVRESARHPLILSAEAQIEVLFDSAVLRGGYGPLAKVEAIQGACAAACAGPLGSGTPDTPETWSLRLLCCLHVAWEHDSARAQSLVQRGCIGAPGLCLRPVQHPAPDSHGAPHAAPIPDQYCTPPVLIYTMVLCCSRSYLASCSCALPQGRVLP